MKKKERYTRTLNTLLRNAMTHAADRYSEKKIQDAFDAVRRDIERLHGRINKLNARLGFDDQVMTHMEEVVVPFVKRKRKRKVAE
jgi:hypothetical protein